MKYIIDGSQKGMVIGAGIVEIDSYGFFENYSFSRNHIAATSSLAEIFAVDCTLSLIEKKTNEQITNVEIYTDNTSVFQLFNTNIERNQLAADTYIGSIQKQLIILKKFIHIEVLLVTEEYKQFHNFSHTLSRTYMKEAGKQAMMGTPSAYTKTSSHPIKTKTSNTNQLLHLDVTKDHKCWELLVNGQPMEKDKKFKNIIERFVKVNQEKIGKELQVELSDDLLRMLIAFQNSLDPSGKVIHSYVSVLTNQKQKL